MQLAHTCLVTSLLREAVGSGPRASEEERQQRPSPLAGHSNQPAGDSEVSFSLNGKQKGGYSGSTKRHKESPLCYIIDGHLSSQNAELEPKFQKYRGRVVIRGGANAVFAEQGSSASHMTAAKVMDVIARLPDCDAQAADAVSAYAQVRMEDAPRLLKIPKSECPHIWIRLPRHKWPKSWANIEDPVVPLDRNLHGYPSAGLLWERQVEEVLLELGWDKVPTWECLFVHRKQG